MPRSAQTIEAEAEQLGRNLHEGTSYPDKALQVVCALVEELANNVNRLEEELRLLSRQQTQVAVRQPLTGPDDPRKP